MNTFKVGDKVRYIGKQCYSDLKTNDICTIREIQSSYDGNEEYIFCVEFRASLRSRHFEPYASDTVSNGKTPKTLTRQQLTKMLEDAVIFGHEYADYTMAVEQIAKGYALHIMLRC